MNLKGTLRVVGDGLSNKSPRQHYWELSRKFGEIAELRRPRKRAFRNVAMDDYWRFLFGAVPIRGQAWTHAQAAFDWLIRAQDATPDGGVSYGYFPTGPTGGWEPSYPETTGYIMTSFVAYYDRTGTREALDRAVRMAEWEADIQMPSGAVQGGKLCPPDQQTPASFNTGMVLDGWVSVNRAYPSERIFDAARRAADFLVADLTEEGFFRTNGAFVSKDAVKTYNCLCAWAMYRFGEDSGEERYKIAAVRAVEAALGKQRDNGWFADNCLSRHEAPLSHTIGYTLQGILEVGLLSGREDFVAAARKGTDPLVACMADRDLLPGRFYADWQPAVLYSCLTGSAQVAIVCYRLAEHLRDDRFREAADKITDRLKAVQRLDSGDRGVDGALAGSFPIYGEYMTGGYPNWATKYLLDALMLQADNRPHDAPCHPVR